MLFNSIDFAIFLPVVFLLYWFVFNNSTEKQNTLLLLASYIFYGWWDWRFLVLIAFSSIIDYTIGLKLSHEKRPLVRKLYLITSIIINIGLLGVFKYYNFFVHSFVDSFRFFGNDFTLPSLSIILPVGISFYTFQTLSYTIDIYRNKLSPTKNVLSFFTFVSYFPQLVAGPIERATNLLPQLQTARKFDYRFAVTGSRQILWGFFKKIVIADNCSIYVNEIFNNYGDYSGGTLLLGSFFFAFQIYGDFSGYSDIAIGSSKLFGVDLMRNFNYPYFSRDIAEFWRRWHISLSTWFRDYVYIPLGGSRGTIWQNIRNVIIIFLVSGLWHGANWTFVMWGAINAFVFLPLLVFKINRLNTDTVAEGSIFPSLKEALQMTLTFIVTLIAWIFFRADNVTHAIDYLTRIIQTFFIHMGQPLLFFHTSTFYLIIFFVIFEWLNRFRDFGLDVEHLDAYKRRFLYVLIGGLIIFFGNFSENEFIYFQF